tara:strand:+ start:398 stop:1003 length:606 start_codon:yes stop_codon:yes gene_type:complete
MFTSETTDKIIPAFVAAQKDLRNTKKNKKGRWDYASIDAILDDVRPILAVHGLAITTDYGFIAIDGGVGTVKATTRLYHTSDQWIQYSLSMPMTNASSGSFQQQVGATCTYARKYQISGILGIAPTDLEDVDALPAPEPEKLISTDGLKKLNERLRQQKITPEELRKRLKVANLAAIKAKDVAQAFAAIGSLGNAKVEAEC